MPTPPGAFELEFDSLWLGGGGSVGRWPWPMSVKFFPDKADPNPIGTGVRLYHEGLVVSHLEYLGMGYHA